MLQGCPWIPGKTEGGTSLRDGLGEGFLEEEVSRRQPGFPESGKQRGQLNKEGRARLFGGLLGNRDGGTGKMRSPEQGSALKPREVRPRGAHALPAALLTSDTRCRTTVTRNIQPVTLPARDNPVWRLGRKVSASTSPEGEVSISCLVSTSFLKDKLLPIRHQHTTVKSPTYEPSSCELTKLGTCVRMSNNVR